MALQILELRVRDKTGDIWIRILSHRLYEISICRIKVFSRLRSFQNIWSRTLPTHLTILRLTILLCRFLIILLTAFLHILILWISLPKRSRHIITIIAIIIIIAISILVLLLCIRSISLQLPRTLRIADRILVVGSRLLILLGIMLKVLLLIFIDIHVITCIIYWSMIICVIHMLHYVKIIFLFVTDACLVKLWISFINFVFDYCQNIFWKYLN